MRGLRTGLILAATLGSSLLVAALGSGASSAPALQAADGSDFGRLRAVILELPAQSRELERNLLARADAVREQLRRGRACVAIRELRSFRKQIAGAAGTRGFGELVSTQVDTEAIAVLAELLVDPRARPCGGAPAGSRLPTVGIQASDATRLRVRVTMSEPRFTVRSGRGRAYTSLAMEGLAGQLRAGKPDVPVLGRFFAVPMGADVSVRVVDSTSFVLDDVKLWPAQPHPADQFGDRPFTIDNALYRSAAAYPASPARVRVLGQLRDLRVGGVELSAARYTPRTHALRVFTSYDVEVSFSGGRGSFGTSRVTNHWSTSYQSLYAGTLLNYELARSVLETVPVNLCGEELLIVTRQALRPAADLLAASRTAAGFLTHVAEIDTGPVQIGTTNTAIRDYIVRELTHDSCIRPSYVVLLGNTQHIPTFLTSNGGYDVGFDGKIASDLPYVLAQGDDLFADAALGRIPAPDLPTALRVVSKIVGYETRTPQLPEDFYRRATFTSYFQGSGSRDDRGFTKTSETIRSALLARNYSVDRVYTVDSPSVDPEEYYDGTDIPAELRRPAFAWNGTTGNVRDQWNQGRFIVFHRDHGYPGGWANPSFDRQDILTLTNGPQLPVVFSINCASAQYDQAEPSFAELLLHRANGGAVGIIGDSRNSSTWTNNHLALGLFDAIFPNVLPNYGGGGRTTRMGDVLNLGKLYMDSQNGIDGQSNAATTAEHRLYGWFGDPSMQIWVRPPLSFLLDAVSAQFVGGAYAVRSSQVEAEGATVTLLQNGKPIGRALLRNGEARIAPEAPLVFERTLSVALEKDGFAPDLKQLPKGA